jgi:hypothetical protein
MKWRAVSLSGMLLCMLFFTAPSWLNAQQEEIILEHKEVFSKLQRPAVKFNHEKHYSRFSECVECHHVYEYTGAQKKNVWNGDGQSCSECHALEKKDLKLPLMEAYHEKCTGCHRVAIKQGKQAGPETCGSCHVRSR